MKDAKPSEMIAYKGLAYLKGDELRNELARMPWCECQIRHEQLGSSRGNSLKRDRYVATVVFDYLLKREFPLTLDEYQLLALGLDKNYVDNFEKKPVRARIVRTDWPAAEGRPASTRWSVEVALDEDLVRVDQLQDDDLFVKSYRKLLSMKPEFASKFAFWVHRPGENEAADPIKPADKAD